MIPVRIDGANMVLQGNGTDVRDLHVLQTEGCFVSRWEPTPKELEILHDGGTVELWVQGKTFAPVMILAKERVEDADHDQ